MEGNLGLIVILTALIVMAILRGRYGRISSTKAHMEEFFTYLPLIGFAVAFSLIVARSPEGRQRYQRDADLFIPFQQKSVPATPVMISQRLSLLRKATPDNCSTCHTAKGWEAFREAAGIVTKDFESNTTTFNMAIKPFQSQAGNHAMVMRALPRSEPAKVDWSRITSWFSPEQRELRKLEKKALQAESSRNILEDRVRDIQEHYGFGQYRQTVDRHLSLYAGAERTGDASLAAYHLLQASVANTDFHAAIAKSGPLKIKARRAMFMLDWGAWVIVAMSLVTRYLIRRLNPEAPWFIYPGITICWCMGICLMTDLSLNYLQRLRFIGFYVWSDVLFCHLAFWVIALIFKPPWFKAVLTRSLAVAHRSWSRFFVSIFAVIALACAFVPAHVASELLKLLIVVFLSWYAIFRGDYIARRTQVAGLFQNLTDSAWLRDNMLGFTLFTGLGGVAFIWLHDFGPLLIIMILLSVYIWLLLGAGTLVIASAVAGAMGWGAYFFRGTLGRLSIFAHIYERFSEMYDPFRLGSGELSKLVWLRKSAGMTGYPFGRIPYFGHYASPGSEMLVTPAQLQSDYSTSHIFTQIGYPLGMVFMVLYFIWILKIFIDSGQLATRREANDNSRFIGWFLALASLLLLIQATLTTAGGLLILPLSGLTLPLTSYGTTSAIFSSIVVATFYAKEEIQ